MASSSWFRVCSLEKIAQPPHCFLIRVAERHGLAGSVPPDRCARSPLHQTCRDRERWSMRLVGQAHEPYRLGAPGGGGGGGGCKRRRGRSPSPPPAPTPPG